MCIEFFDSSDCFVSESASDGGPVVVMRDALFSTQSYTVLCSTIQRCFRAVIMYTDFANNLS